ncbi:phBC6A51 family helix-turn-helix protein [Paenibacillus larvae]|uniref:Homeodomain phBC6A51-type domain-containing protein n=1 Tax=Paenibacillus larvae subsp. pulvifaciens TaxID=1477 RepID=A0A1V0UYT0_9BACL|nr:phBC6A51 family helix-turn-helix protein [Paenibacillus larvae]ARF67609.1 hypothetical protein B7C51_06865 [Paenibacillus larvae subsp. pulvifaciens]ARF70336.1 hypothetical protein B7C51_24545 [Paenibacillus larvae subsp. pulvifaciens]MCY9512272.1 phBC6A51 family helix-turn-helix protein [Paenibacillus larvae]MCY9527158.1 phBC6A51 family helix-turn-helix protein [Paenibacillus larvae]
MKRLETKHYIAIGYLALPDHGGLTMEQIAKEAGISRRALYEWTKEPVFERELKREIIRKARNRLPQVVNSMADAAIEERSAAAAKLLFQMEGMLKDTVEVETKTSDTVDPEALAAKLAAFRARKDTDVQ